MTAATPPCVPGAKHFPWKGACIICDIKLPCCANCAFSSDFDREDGLLSCGLHPDGDPQPIWAARKFTLAGLRRMLAAGKAVAGEDCESMSPWDGAECLAFSPATGGDPK